MIVDAHVHVFPQLAGLIGRGVVEPLAYGKARLGNGEVLRVLPPLAPVTRFPAEAMLEYMDWAGVDKAVLLQGPFYGNLNGYVDQVVRQWPDRFIGVAQIDPMLPSASADFYRAMDQGFRAVKMECTEQAGLTGLYRDLDLGDPHFSWLWEAADRLGLSITLDLGAVGSRSYQTAQVRQLIERCKKVHWVIAHLCWPSPQVRAQPELEVAWSEQVRLASYPNVWLDLAALPAFFPDEVCPYPSIREFFARAKALVGAEKLLWGTDVPGLLTILTYQQLRDVFLHHCDMSVRERELVFGANALIAYGVNAVPTNARWANKGGKGRGSEDGQSQGQDRAGQQDAAASGVGPRPAV